VSAFYPDVPIFPGVPAVFRRVQTELEVAELSEQLQDDQLNGEGGPVSWGIFNADGSVALEPDSIFMVEPSAEYRISDYPVERGGFQSYNKVTLPAENRVTVTKGGSNADRADFLTALDAIMKSLDAFSIVTPDGTFLDRNPVRYNYSRSAENGATLLKIEIQFQEIRQTAVAAFSNSKAPSGADAVNNGPVRPVTPATTQLPAQGPPS
jgi:hypothetical protein